MFDVVNATLGRVDVKRLPPFGLREGLRGPLAAGRSVEEFDGDLGGFRPADVPAAQPGVHVLRVDGVDLLVQQPAAAELAEDCRDAAGPVNVLHQEMAVGGHLADAWHPLREFVDVGHLEVHLGLAGGREQMKHRVG